MTTKTPRLRSGSITVRGGGLPLKDAAAVLALDPDFACQTCAGSLDIGFPAGWPCAFEVRAVFSGAHGEMTGDPATGSLDACLAQWLIAAGHATAPYVSSQGKRLGREALIRIDRDTRNRIWVGGNTTTRIEGAVQLWTPAALGYSHPLVTPYSPDVGKRERPKRQREQRKNKYGFLIGMSSDSVFRRGTRGVRLIPLSSPSTMPHRPLVGQKDLLAEPSLELRRRWTPCATPVHPWLPGVIAPGS